MLKDLSTVLQVAKVVRLASEVIVQLLKQKSLPVL